MMINSLPDGPGQSVNGNLDGVTGTRLFGWIIAPEGTQLRILADGQFFDTTTAHLVRSDVASVYKCDVHCGFSVDLSLLERFRVHEITVKAGAVAGDYDFGGRTIRWCEAVEEHRAELLELFMPGYYRGRNGLDRLDDAEAFEHYLHEGIYDDLGPIPWFDNGYFREHQSAYMGEHDLPVIAYLQNRGAVGIKPSAHFDADHYRDVHRDLGPSRDPLKHYVSHGYQEGRSTEPPRLPDKLLEEVAALRAIEPALPSPESLLRGAVVHYPNLHASTWDARRVRAAFPERIDAVVCIPFLSLGGADLIATYALRALQEEFGSEHVLLIVTEGIGTGISSRLPEGTQVHNLCRVDYHPGLGERCTSLHEIVATLCPVRVVNVNSHACWEMYRILGRQLSSRLDLVAYLFCFDYGPDGRLGGYIADYLGDTLQYLHAVVCDNSTIIDDIAELYGFANSRMERLSTAYTPVPDEFVVAGTIDRSTSQKRPKVLWTGRLARQKRPDRLLAIAERLGSLDFEVYGPAGDAPEAARILEGAAPNIIYRGTYESLAEIDANAYSLFLNTSAWDGLPTVLVQMAGMGIPLVTSGVGGIGEFVDETTGWVIDDDDSIDTYVAAIHRMLFNPREARERSDAALERVRSRHNWSAYKAALAEAGLFARDPERLVNVDIDRRKYG